MRIHHIPVLLLISSMTSACVSWPILGSGGMAEHQTSHMHYDSSLFFEYELAKQQLEILTLKGAEYCFPATIIQARQRQNRILRQLHGGLELDAANDLIIQRDHLKQLEKRFNAVTLESSCIPPTEEQVWLSESQIEHLYNLLNSGPQFEDDSNALTEGYISKLAEACFLLRESGDFNLHVTAHIENVDDSAQHDQLTQSRSLMLQRYLQLFGIKKQNIHVSTINSADLLIKEHLHPSAQSNPKVSVILTEVKLDIAYDEAK